MDKVLKELTLKVWRQKGPKEKGHFETYKVHNISQGSSSVRKNTHPLFFNLFINTSHIQEA